MNRFVIKSDDAAMFIDTKTSTHYYVDISVNPKPDSIPIQKLAEKIVELLNEHGVE